MKQEQIYIVMQPEASSSFWVNLLYSGICEAAAERHDTICTVNIHSPEHDLCEKNVLVTGNNIDWIRDTAGELINLGAHPVIVNACMLPVKELRCSGVSFELEEMLDQCVRLLADAGRTRVVLLGANPTSIADRVKADSFLRAIASQEQERIIWSPGSLDECVMEFAGNFKKLKYDAVICPNDTVAIRLIHQLSSRKVSLPDELFIIGMGNSYVGSNLKLGLTSVTFDYHEMGRTSVWLYHELLRVKTSCHMMISLPCRLNIRGSAPLSKEQLGTKPKRIIKPPAQAYFDGEAVQNIIWVENLLQSHDSFDREILFGISRGESCDSIAKRLFFSDRAVRYRLSNLVRESGFSSRGELEAAIRKAVGEL